MIPNKKTAWQELEIAGKLNPGLWTDHSKNVALAAHHIASYCPRINADTAYVLGLLHDIGRRTGVAAVRHIIDGYDYAVTKGWEEVGRICLTHSFPIKDIEADIGKKDITTEQYNFIEHFLDTIVYDEYDKLIILCDALADAKGFCILEKRFVDTTRRYGIFPFTVERWNRTIEYKEYFESMMNRSIYSVLPEIEKCIF